MLRSTSAKIRGAIVRTRDIWLDTAVGKKMSSMRVLVSFRQATLHRGLRW